MPVIVGTTHICSLVFSYFYKMWQKYVAWVQADIPEERSSTSFGDLISPILEKNSKDCSLGFFLYRFLGNGYYYRKTTYLIWYAQNSFHAPELRSFLFCSLFIVSCGFWKKKIRSAGCAGPRTHFKQIPHLHD